MPKLNISPIPAFTDNYFWIIHDGSEALVVDPGDATPVIDYLESQKLTLTTILITHHHADHVGGVVKLKKQYDCHVFGPKNEKINGIDTKLEEGDTFTLDNLKLSFEILDVPGHTLGHIAYYSPKSQEHEHLLFCGDTLFSAGCGRLFEGTPKQMWQSMQKILALPEQTFIYPAHEYTLDNLKFAHHIEPNNQQIEHHTNHTIALRRQNKPSLPTNLALEKSINPFLRVNLKAFQQGLSVPVACEEPDKIFGAVRQLKDQF